MEKPPVAPSSIEEADGGTWLKPDEVSEGQAALFPDWMPVSEPPPSLSKAVAAVHMYAVTGTFNLFARRVFNALLSHALDKWNQLPADRQAEIYDKRIVPRFAAPVSDIRLRLNLTEDDHRYTQIYDAIGKLFEAEFRFDVMGDLGHEWTVRSRLISQWARTRDGSGLIQWEYPPDVFKMLMQPMPFARLDLALANSLRSGYALALYENCARYIHNPAKLTSKLPLESWMLLLGNSKALYCKSYRDFKANVLKRALEELAASPACPLQLTLLETRGARGKVTHLQFKVELKTQLPLPTEMGRGMDPRVRAAILKLGVSREKLDELLITMEESDLVTCLQRTHDKVRKGQLTNPAGFFISQCREAMELSDEEEAHEDDPVRVKKVVPLDPVALARERGDALRAAFWKLDPVAQEQWLARFKTHPCATPVVLGKLASEGLSSPMAGGTFFGWLAEVEEGTLLPKGDDAAR